MAAVAALAGILFHALGGGLDDGAYLQLSFSEELLAGESFRVNVDDPSSDATANPLLVGLLSAGRLIFGGEAGTTTARVLGVLILVGFGLSAFFLAVDLGAEPIIACIAGLAVALSPSVITASSSLQPIAFDALFLVIAVIGVLRGIGTLAIAAGALTLTSYPGMFAGLAFALAVPAIDAVKRKQLEKRYLLLLIPFALAAARAVFGPILFESNPLREVLAPLTLCGATAMEQRIALVAALPIRIFTLLGASVVGFLLAAAAFSLAVPKLRLRTSLAAIVISVVVTYLVMRGGELMVLWAAPLVVVVGVTWCGSYWKERGRVRLWVTVAVALAFVVPPLANFPQSGVEGNVLDLCRRVPEILPPRTVIATSQPGAYRCIADVPVVDLSGALPPKICEGPRNLAVVLESWARRVRIRRPTYVVSDGVNIAEVRSTPLLERVFPKYDVPDAIWRIDWEPLERREGLWDPGVLERIGDGMLINWLDIGGGGESAGIVNLETYGPANLDWKLALLPVEMWGRSTTLADTCRVCRNAEAVRVDVLLPPLTRVVCLRLYVSGASEPACRAESGAYSTFCNLTPERWTEMAVGVPKSAHSLTFTFMGLGTGSEFGLGGVWFFN
ncbi:MAG: hypothetical protein NTW26_00860 [bacterium]|nr:hypothetical protein [bacterium]